LGLPNERSFATAAASAQDDRTRIVFMDGCTKVYNFVNKAVSFNRTLTLYIM
jgi:hypothetical protein